MADPDPKNKTFMHSNPRTGKMEEFDIENPGLGRRIIEAARVGTKEYSIIEEARAAERKRRGLPTE